MIQALGLALVLFSFAEIHATELNCKGVYKKNNPKEPEVILTVELRQVYRNGAMVKHEGELKNRYFSVTGDISTLDLMLNISEGPEYTKGSVIRAAPNLSGVMRMSTVDGFEVYRLECQATP